MIKHGDNLHVYMSFNRLRSICHNAIVINAPNHLEVYKELMRRVEIPLQNFDIPFHWHYNDC